MNLFMTTDIVATKNENAPQFLIPANLREEVYAWLRKRILSHEYPPGFRFYLQILETELGISRTPLKEALHRLEVEGLVEIQPRRGTFVISINPQSLAEDFDVRRAPELYAAEAAVREATDQDLQQLKALAEEMRRLPENNDYQSVVDRYIHLDHEFHILLVGLARNRRLIEIH